jgi:hypothetical protein
MIQTQQHAQVHHTKEWIVMQVLLGFLLLEQHTARYAKASQNAAGHLGTVNQGIGAEALT